MKSRNTLQVYCILVVNTITESPAKQRSFAGLLYFNVNRVEIGILFKKETSNYIY